jgi:ribA/ribD-fused uncharacterized protein
MTIKFYKSVPPYGYLNNFDTHSIYVFDREWDTVEHAYQAQKTQSAEEYDSIWKAKTPREARNLGQAVTLRKDWDLIKDSVMKECVLAKFTQHLDLQNQLLATGDEELVEDSNIDWYWGCGSNGKGQNKLGKILMEVRKELRNGNKEGA